MIYAQITIKGAPIIITLKDKPKYKTAIKHICKELELPLSFLTRSHLQFENIRIFEHQHFKTPQEIRIFCNKRKHQDHQ